MSRILWVLTLLASGKVWAVGSISGGGLPGPVEVPAENYSYVCDVEFSQQINTLDENQRHQSCLVSFKAEPQIIFHKAEQFSPMGELGSIKLKDLKLQKQYGSGGVCGKKPIFNPRNTFFTLRVYKNKGPGFNHGQFETSLYLRVAAPTDLYSNGSASTSVRYDAGYVEASTSWSSANQILSLSVECTKVQP